MIDCIKHYTVICIAALLLASFAHAVEEKEPAVAMVNGVRILMSELDMEMQKEIRNNPEMQSNGDLAARRQLRKKVLDDLINQELVVQEGKKVGLEPQQEQIDTEFGKIKKRFPSQDAFEQVMKKQNMTEERLREIIERAFIVKNVLEVKIEPLAKPVTDKEVADYYEAHKGEFTDPEEIRASHILIKLSSGASDEEKTYSKKEMQAILEEAKGGADFAELAKKHSQCPSAVRGGDLGYFARGDMVKPFEEAAFALEPGQISDIVETEFGYHIIRLEDRKPGKQLELEEVSEGIKKELHDREMNIALRNWLKPLREKADIKIML
jgi:peptidyl-prolyl cis-trans isomerase C